MILFAYSAINLCADCPTVQVSTLLCPNAWIPQYGNIRPGKNCQCLDKYVCCPSQCAVLNNIACPEGKREIQFAVAHDNSVFVKGKYGNKQK